MKNLIVTLSLLATLLTLGCASASETVPTTTPDGLDLVRAYDSKADPDSFVNYANKITNRQAADRMLKNWATRLREAMDAVMRPSASEA